MAAYVSGDFYSVFCTNNSVNMCPVILTIKQVVVKGYHECPLSVEVGERCGLIGFCSNLSLSE